MTAMNLADLATAIRTRLIASAGIGTYARGHFYIKAPAEFGPTVGELPYTVFHLQATQDDAFSVNGFRVQLTVMLFDHALNGDAPINTLFDRIYGNSLPPSTAPTYGLHRHQLTGTGDNNAGLIVFRTLDPLFLEESGDGFGTISIFDLTHEQGEPS